MKRKKLQKWRWRGKPERPSTANSARPVFTTTRPSRLTTTGPIPSRPNPPTTNDNSAASTSMGQKHDVQPVNCSDGECEVERHSLNSSLGLEDEDDNTDVDDSTTTSPTTDLSEPSTFSVRARKRIQLQTTTAARPSTADLPGASAFSPTTASESNPEWNPFRRQGVWRRQLKASMRKKNKRRLKQRWRGKPGRTLTASPPRPVFTITHPNCTTTTGPTPSRPNHPTTTKPSASSPNPLTTTDNSAASTAVRRKRDVQPYNLFGVFPVHCSNDFVDGDISKEVECFAESRMIEIAYYKARGSCTSPEYLDSFFEECKGGEEGAGEDFPFEKAYGKDLLQH